MANNFKKRSLILAMGLALSTPLYAAEEKQSDEEEEEGAQTMVIVGSRAAPRSIGDSPVPVDVISAEEMQANGTSDMTSLLASVAPSFNVNTQPISDAATMVRPANLRGLSPDSTLILVNGKRRHRSAVISFLGGGISDGAQGPDTSVIPAIALKQVEVLRDGASAQYGSDAIAGVINFVLKDNSSGGSLEVKTGSYAEGDGDQLTFAANIGMPLSERGFVNFSAEINSQDATDRSIQRPDAQDLIDAGNTAVANPAQIWGSPNVMDDVKLFMNVGLDLGDNKEAYMFANYADREVDGGFFFRNPHNRGGVFGDDVYDDMGTPDDDSDDELLGWNALIGDLTFDGTGNCPAIFTPVGQSLLDQPGFQQVLDDPNCFSFAEMFPGGFTPRFGGFVTDVSMVMGTRGEFSDGTYYDFSGSVGQNTADFRIRNTVNANLGPLTPTDFDPGTYRQREVALNADFSKDLETGFDSMALSYGFEIRQDTFEIKNGDPDSFANTLGTDRDLAIQGFSIGSNGFQGFSPVNAGIFSRTSKGAYLDLETYVTVDWMVGVALRTEDFSDFGSTFDYKISTKYDVNDELGLRGSISTGFRAPTVGQSNVRNVSTNFSPDGGLQEIATIPPTSDVALKLGGTALDPEESDSLTFGFVYEKDDFFLTVDLFRIEVEGRISQTSDISLVENLTQEEIDELIADNPEALNFAAIRYFTNDFDTVTTGVDIVANYSQELWGGNMKYGFAYNYTDTEVDSAGEFVGATKVKVLEENVPNNRGFITANFSKDDWSLIAKLNYYGRFYEAHLDSGSLPIYADNAYLVDMEYNMDINESVGFAVGTNNLFDEYPTENPHAGVVGARYPTTSPFGFNGRFMYAKVTYDF